MPRPDSNRDGAFSFNQFLLRKFTIQISFIYEHFSQRSITN